ncbi:hypothetical protein [Promicromonospora soli]|uniref:Uncharacterized protein n=1 Tax=Promicromonospora soli TaxID=2035533 RepID=A0A919G3I9_9MICO|nr:hypothetical protein [Promicromonospora soli]GHH77241.1 hypothetical protein GCM10017772_37730 [Promicromonospora soli]
MSSDSDAPQTEGGEKTERMDRLRALLTKPIKIPESASSDSEDADYAAPVASAAAPKGARTPMKPQGTTPKGAKVPVETPPAVKAAAEALDRLTDEEKDAVVESAGSGSGRPSRSRRTWADAYLARPDKPLTPEEVRAELTVALKEQGAEFRELVAKQTAAQEKAAAELTSRLEGRLDELASSTERAAASAREEATRLQGRLDELASSVETLRTDLSAAHAVAEAARAAADSAATAAAAARAAADAATRKVATATTFAWVGIALALVAAVVAFVV